MRSSVISKSLLRHCRRVNRSTSNTSRGLHTTSRLLVVKPFLLADIGEGIRECEVIQWFVEPEARVEQFDKICEVQSDKASVDVSSRYTGVIKKLHYEAGQMAIVGKPLVDIDVQGEEGESENAAPAQAKDEKAISTPTPANVSEPSAVPHKDVKEGPSQAVEESPPRSKHFALATPAVRHLSKELDINIEDVNGTGKDGRVSKDDIYRFVEARDSGTSTSSPSISGRIDGPQQETAQPLTTVQAQMFKTMTRSLTIPHFLYADEVDFTCLSALRSRLNASLHNSAADGKPLKLSYLPFIIKAMSLAINQYPILNARVEVNGEGGKPALVMRSQHNIGVAMDTPSGLLVPVIKNVASLSLSSIANELKRLQSLATAGKLASSDLSGGTITITNIGSIGGTYVSPVIVDKEVAIMGVGKMRKVPAFGKNGELVEKQITNFSWSADHRVVDGATVARAAEVVRGFVEEPALMLVHLR